MEPSKPLSQSQLRYRLAPTLGLVGGGLLGFVDAIYFSSIDLSAQLGGQQVNPVVVLGFTLTLALFGYILGRLVVARAQAQADRRTIAAQHDALRQSQQALVQQEKLAALGRLVASIAHELRNPLGVIRSATGLLQESTRQGAAPQGMPKLRRAAQLVTEEVDHMNATITALLAFARPTALERQEVNLDHMLDRALHLTEAQARPGIEVERSVAGSPGTVVGDANLLTQLLAGLLDNACAATNGQGRIEVRAVPGPTEMRIEVADDGPGIDAEAALRVFEPFYTTKASGTGLGLALAHHIADAHGGRLEVIEGAGTGPEGRGACLRLSLPREEPTDP